MANTDLHIEKTGNLPKPRSQSPKTIKALGQARDSFTRILAGGFVLGVLTIAYVVALFNKLEGASNILVVIGSGLGFLLGSGRNGRGTDDQ